MSDVTARFTRKVGPLPVYAWAGLIVVGYFLYHHFKASAGSGQPAASGGNSSVATDGSATYVPGSDQSLGSTTAGNSMYNTPPVTNIYNYYYGDAAGNQAGGGGTGGSGGARTTVDFRPGQGTVGSRGVTSGNQSVGGGGRQQL